jgi:hypothetical protein
MLVKQIYLGMFLVFLVGSCVYLFPPGMPQPADLLMAVLVVALATGFIIKPPVDNDVVFVGILFVGYVALVNLFWFTQYHTPRFWLTALYYAYDFAALMVVVSLVKASRERFIATCRIAFAVAIVLEIIAVSVLPQTKIRAIGTFNNPNQLGYWSLVVGCCWLVLKRDQKLTATDFLVLCGAGYLTATSLSKAAMLSFTLVLLIGMVVQRLTRSAKLMLLAMVFAGTSSVLLNPSSIERLFSIELVQRVDKRLAAIGQQGDDSAAGRGYDRIWKYPEHLIFGAGEGATWRFSGSEIVREKNKEMHSTLGTVLFSYGIIGFALFCALLVMVFREAPLAHKLYSLPIWAYGMTHQGLRDTMLWVFLGTVFGVAHYARSASPEQTVAAPEPGGPARASAVRHGLRTSGAGSAGD